MAQETIRVRGTGGGVFDVVVTPLVTRKLKSGVLVRIDVPETVKRGKQGKSAVRAAGEEALPAKITDEEPAAGGA